MEDNFAHATDFGIAIDFVDAGFLLVKAVLQGFDCNVKTNLVAKLETIRHGLRCRIDMDALCHFSVRVALCDRRIRQSIDSTSRPIELALPVEAQEVHPRNADGFDVAGPHDSMLADILHGSLKRLRHKHRHNTSLLNRK